ncbi:hypothetical protein [Chondrinema litorale]|uniref:hypothetical protein n=1 Tax=Chondrinema litorale TaxID=2994555 RepID=UPI00254272D9|nr:hypothetical protein [Chondrinema litorale]UZR95914.1 hypothetical protein OQ292_08815 [Chondrinema litorale]
MERKDDNMEGLIQQFIKEMMTRGFNKFRQANNGRNPGLDDLFDLFEKFKGKEEATSTSTSVRVNEDDKESNVSKDLEIKYLKDQVEQLKQQLNDKDKIIQMLSKTDKKKKKV